MPYLTYFDVVEHLITSSFGGPQDAEQRDIRTAVQRAYQELTTMRDWSYYHVHGRVITQTPYTAGSISVSGTTVTLTGGTWPAWAASGAYIKANNEIARVASRTSDSVLVSDATICFKESLANQSYALFRTVYPLPSDFRNLDQPSDEYHWWSGFYLTPDEAMKLERVSNSSGEPYHWTVIKDPDSSGWAIKLIGYPTRQETIDFTYRRTARQIRYSGHESSARQGTISKASTTVAGSGTAFSTAMVGAVLRVGDTSSTPGPLASITPYAVEAKVLTVGSASSLTTETSAGASASTKYIITDPIDIPEHMHNCMYSAAEYWLARIRNQKADAAFAMYQRDLRLAMEQDQLAPLSGRSQEIWHDGGWQSPLRPDQGT